jgi:diguanylate cyclase (GGDEF)-like protein
MTTDVNGADRPASFVVTSALLITGAGVVLLTPFGINNFLQGRALLGVGSLIIVGLCAINTWNCWRDQYEPLVILLSLTPCIILFLAFALCELGILGTFWCYPAALSFYFLLPGRYAWIANMVLLGVILPQAWGVLESPVAVRFAATLFTMSLFAGVSIRFITSQQEELEAMAVTDVLTGLFNRTHLHGHLERALQQSRRAGTAMTLPMLDIDNFKAINDAFGHPAGDDVLRGMETYFRRRIRNSDMVFRIGGEEFMVLLHDTNESDARRTAAEVCAEIKVLPLLPGHDLTVSIGIAALDPDDELEDWVKRSDEKLYVAKSRARDQVVV